jgi:hypothetical protein
MGADSFTEADGRFFFGREKEIRHLTSLVVSNRVVVFYAQSGAGKTSLLQAKLIPSLREEWEMLVLSGARVGGDLPPGLVLKKDDNVYVFNTLYSLAGEDARPREIVKVKGLQEGLARYLERQDEAPRPCLLVLDQFEELFSAYPEFYEKRAEFFWQLQQCLSAYPRLGVLLSMREDYIAHLDYHAIQMPNRLRSRFRIQRLDKDQAMDAITKPAEQAGRSFQPEAAEKLRDNLRRIQAGAMREGVEMGEELLGAYVEPLHLSVVCERLWDRLPPGDQIEEEHVHRFGDVDQTLIHLYEESLAKALRAVKDTDCDERRLREWFEEKLITEANTRRPVYRGEAETEGVPNEAVDALSETRVLRRVPRGRDDWYELVHDRLVGPIRQANLAVLDDYRKGRRLDELGWGVIFAHDTDPAVHRALTELLELRQSQAGERYQAFTEGKGYRRGETVREFVERHGRRGIELPYYLLIVGEPEEIPYEFQYGLAMKHAVGRIDFGDDLQAYANYARSVAYSARGGVALAREAVIFGVQYRGDDMTQAAAEMLYQPLAERLREGAAAWEVRRVFDEGATKSRLGQLLGGTETPALLFVAGRAATWPEGDPRQKTDQGALVCVEWPGPREWRRELSPDFYFAAGDLADEAQLLGLMAFLFAPQSAGTPRQDDFAFFRHRGRSESSKMADRGLVAPLARRLLGHSSGGAQAVIGHVNDNWGASFQDPDGSAEIGHFVETMNRLMAGHTVGSAMEPFRQRYALLSSRLGERMVEVLFGEEGGDDDEWREDQDLLLRRLMAIDTRNYVIVGDPAVHLPLATDPQSVRRPSIEPIELDALLAPEKVPEVTEGELEAEVVEEVTVAEPVEDALPEVAQWLFCNGINAFTGEYLWPPITIEELAELARSTEPDASRVREVERRASREQVEF